MAVQLSLQLSLQTLQNQLEWFKQFIAERRFALETKFQDAGKFQQDFHVGLDLF